MTVLSAPLLRPGAFLPIEGKKAKRRGRRKNAPDLPFRSQSAEKLDENYQRAEDMSTRLTYFSGTEIA
jgi:hypothetical protein